VNKFCASAFPDYEGELVVVTSKTCRDVSPEEAHRYILGYTIGNDLTCRYYQIPQYGGGQYMFAKGFDKFAPIGPVLVSPEVYGQGAELTTRVNGEVRQHIKIGEGLTWTPEQIISHMSQGTTVPAGSMIMTGTPHGVGAFMEPPTWLQNGDVVDVEITGIGVLRNKMVFREASL